MSDDPTRDISTENTLDSLISLVRQVASDVAEIKGRLQQLEATVEQRLYDTRPIWEGVQAQLGEIRGDIRRLDHKIDLQNRTIGDLYADQKDLEHRVENLEPKS
jgi:chromosome segregation ATPase